MYKYFLFFVYLFSLNSIFSQENTAEIAEDIVKTVEKYHYSPIPIDDEFSTRVFSTFLKEIDPSKIYLSHQDITLLDKFKLTLDEKILEKDITLLTTVTTLLENKITERISLLKTLQSSDLQFNKDDYITTSEKESHLSQSDINKKWKEIIQVNLLIDFFDDDTQSVKEESAFHQYVKEKLPTYLEEVVCMMEEKYSINEGLATFVHSKYLSAISSVFDPHTQYFNSTEEKEFNNSLSKEALSFGMELYKNNDGKFEVYQLAPGGPAWNSQSINEGDLLEHITTTSNAKEINLGCLSSQEFHKIINETTAATFTFKKVNGSQVKLSLEKKKVEVVENVIDSYILNGKQKLGYLYLPSFYSNEREGTTISNGCANDIAKELIRLKREGIEGLIFDLRDNGGGSMLEAIRLAGIFVNYGGITISDTRNEEPSTLKDPSRGMVFTKPLVILVNGYSASASELFAAAMQDYNRAIIVGNNTFGKSTMQRVLPVNAHRFNENSTLIDQSSEKGFLKITEGTFFRVTGKSHQGNGVVVDIALAPESQDGYNEASLPYSLPNSTIEKKAYYTPLAELPIAELQQLSKNRLAVKQEKTERTRNNSIPLSFEKFTQLYSQNTEEENATPLDSIQIYSAELPPYILGMDISTEKEKEMQKRIINSIENDSFIIESYQLLNDFIKLNN